MNMVGGGGAGGQDRTNLERRESVRDEALSEEESNSEDPDGNDDESAHNPNKNDSINRLVVVKTAPFFIGLIDFLGIFL